MSSAGTTVNNIISNAISQAALLTLDTEDATQFAVKVAQSMITPERVDLFINPLTVSPVPEISLVDPGVFTGSFVSPDTSLTLPAFRDPVNVSIPQIPTPPAALDTSDLFLTPRPVFNVPDIIGDVPDVDTNFVFPTSPIISFPDAPEPIALTFPTVTNPVLPTFDAQFLGVLPVSPDVDVMADYRRMIPEMKALINDSVDEFIRTYAPLHQSAMSDLETRIAQRMAGGTAANEAWEQAIYDQQRQRIYAETTASVDEANDAATKRGFSFPQATLASLIAKISSNASDRLAASATEVAIKRHEIELNFLQFIMGLSQQLRQTILSTAISHVNTIANVNGQAIDIAKAIASSLVELYNSAVRTYEVQTQLYRTEADVFEAKLRSALASLETAKVLLDIENSKLNANQVQVAIYTSQIEAISKQINLYVAQLDGVKTKAEIEKLKIDLFGEIARAQLTIVQAKEAEFNAYRAAIEGDTAKVNAYAKEVDAFSSQVNAQKVIVDAQVAGNTAISQFNQAQQARYSTTVDQVKTELQVSLAEFTTNADAYGKRLEQFKTAADIRLKNAEINLETFRATTDASIRSFEGNVRQVETLNNLKLERVKILTQASSSMASVLGSVASTYVSSLNTMAQVAENTLLSE